MASSRESNGRFKKGTHWRSPQKHWCKKWLTTEYVTKKRSASEIAAECCCGETNILYWLAKHKIPRRDMKEVRKIKRWGQSGENNPMFGMCDDANPSWLGGISPDRQKLYSRAMWRQLRSAVLERDGHKCQKCGAGNTGPRSIHTHHIQEWLKHPNRRFDIDNIVTLCRKCHEWVHGKENKSNEYLA